MSASAHVTFGASAMGKHAIDQDEEDDEEEMREEDGSDEDVDEEAEEDEDGYEQGLEGLLALASKALQDAAASSASSTPAALATSEGQWQEGAPRLAADHDASEAEGHGGGQIRPGKRRKPSLQLDAVGHVANADQTQI